MWMIFSLSAIKETETDDKIQKQSGALARCKKNNMIQVNQQ
jgi:hypothetical protein